MISNAMEGSIILRDTSPSRKLRDNYRQVEVMIEETKTPDRGVLDCCGDGVLILRGGTMLYSNPRYREILGYHGPEGLPEGPVFPAADDETAGLAAHVRNMQKGIPSSSVLHCVLRKRDGSPVHVAVSASPITHGGEPAVICFIRDITKERDMEEELSRTRDHLEDLVKERTALLEEENIRLRAEIDERARTEESLRQSEAKYRSILDHAVEGIFRIGPGGALLSVNPAMAHMHGFETPEEMIALVTDLATQLHVGGAYRAALAGLLRKTGMVKGFEAKFRKKDGAIIWGSLNVRVEKDPEGKVLFYEGTIEDITSRKATEEELRQIMERLSNSLKGAISAMSLTVETRDPYTSGHQKKVSILASLIAQEMGLSVSAIDNVRMAGILHDIGKMSVPAEILSKPRNLTDTEMNLLKVHPQSGYEILKEAELPYPIAAAVLQHHERLNGSGYPLGLKGEEILLEARIIAVADVVEALASHRPYRAARGIEAALEEIGKNRGVLYDEQAVDACVRLFREKGFTLDPQSPHDTGANFRLP